MKKLLLILFLLFIINSLVGCSVAGEGGIISKYPDRLIYIAGYDTELDLTGGEIVVLLRDLNKRYMQVEFLDNKSYINCISHDIDFNVPGIYIVTFNHYKRSDSFAIQVVEVDYIDNIINRK